MNAAHSSLIFRIWRFRKSGAAVVAESGGDLPYLIGAAALILTRWTTENPPESVTQSRPGFAWQCGHSMESGLMGRTGGMAGAGAPVHWCLFSPLWSLDSRASSATVCRQVRHIERYTPCCSKTTCTN